MGQARTTTLPRSKCRTPPTIRRRRSRVAKVWSGWIASLEALPVELRECLVLRELEGLSYKEIGNVAGIPIGTVMSRLWRARQALMGGQAEAGP